MKKTFFTILIIIPLILMGTGCEPVDDNNNGSTGGAVTGPSVEMSKSTVNSYMKHTLGTLPDSEIDYEKAKEYMTPAFAEEFDTPMFVPVSYCIQDGPEKVRIDSVEELGGETLVNVSGLYGGDWVTMWTFSLESVNGDWLINGISCLEQAAG